MGIEHIKGLDKAIQSDKENKQTNEMRILREFVEEFNPIYQGQTEDFTYNELISIVKEIVKEL